MVSTNEPAAQEEPNVPPLEGWKAIADALGVSIRTAQYWARAGMPVFRLMGQILAMKSELEFWRRMQKRHVAAARVGARRA